MKHLLVWQWVAVGLVGLVALGSIGGYVYYRSIDSGIKRVVVGNLGPRPKETGALNILLIGSDSRKGANKKYGATTTDLSERTDTMMVLHISPNRDNATMISFPRDSMVLIPQCGTVPGGIRQINSAFNEGGIDCTMTTIESLTGIHLDHFIKVDFSGFKAIVDALEGIEICLPKPVNDPLSKLVLGAGKHVVKGEQALGYVRTRYKLGNGSDLGRIERQQIFLNKVMEKATDGGLLTNPVRLDGFLRAATKAVTVDSELTFERMLEIANSVSGLTAKELKGTTVPIEPYPLKPEALVQFKEPDAKAFFERVVNDNEVTPPPATGASTAPKIARDQVRIQVLNGTGEGGQAGRIAEELTAQGFVVVETGNVATTAKTSIRYGKKRTDAVPYADAVSARLSQDKRTPTAGMVRPLTREAYKKAPATLKTPLVQLVIGTDWPGVRVLSTIPDSMKDKVIDNNTDPCK
jgi:LCP family protein required for cell wall assembly